MTFKIIKTLYSFPETSGGWHKELNIISWNDRMPKYDLRPWNEDHSKAGKGITLSKEEMIQLFHAINGLDFERSGVDA